MRYKKDSNRHFYNYFIINNHNPNTEPNLKIKMNSNLQYTFSFDNNFGQMQLNE